MKQEKKFLRQCASCREYKKKEELIRLTKDHKTGEVTINNDNSSFGRSIYVCKNEECLKNFIKKKRTEHILKAKLSVNIEEELYTVLKN